jgi:hypothetical protein
MTIRRILLALSFAGTLAAQTFIQMSDPQFGMYTKNAGFEHETVNFEFAIASGISSNAFPGIRRSSCCATPN